MGKINMENNFNEANEQNDILKESACEEHEKSEDIAIGEDDDNPLGFKEEKKEDELYTIEYGSDKKSFTLDELKESAEKGLKYDHIKAEYDKLKNSPALSIINSMAKQNNQSAYEFAFEIARQKREQKEAELILRGVPQREAKRLCELEEENQRQIIKKEADRPFDEFVRQFPDVRAEDIDKSVWEEFKRTNDLTAAYAKFENRHLKSQIEMLKQNNENKKRSIGAAESSANAMHDAFLEGLFE